MEIETHTIKDIKIAEVISDDVIIKTIDDGLDLLGTLYYQGFDKIIIHGKNITPDFFDLKNGIAGEILQKFSNYRVRLAIVGDYSQYSGKSIKDFIIESNKTLPQQYDNPNWSREIKNWIGNIKWKFNSAAKSMKSLLKQYYLSRTAFT